MAESDRRRQEVVRPLAVPDLPRLMLEADARDQVVAIDEVGGGALAEHAGLARGEQPFAGVDRLDGAVEGVDTRQIDDRHDAVELQIQGVAVLAGADQREALKQAQGRHVLKRVGDHVGAKDAVLACCLQGLALQPGEELRRCPRSA